MKFQYICWSAQALWLQCRVNITIIHLPRDMRQLRERVVVDRRRVRPWQEGVRSAGCRQGKPGGEVWAVCDQNSAGKEVQDGECRHRGVICRVGRWWVAIIVWSRRVHCRFTLMVVKCGTMSHWKSRSETISAFVEFCQENCFCRII